jgi:murein DD-endopeptidase MepM/ murein hydrolase activator NlpD
MGQVIVAGQFMANRIETQVASVVSATLQDTLWSAKNKEDKAYKDAYIALDKLARDGSTANKKKSFALNDKGKEVELIQEALIKLKVLSESESVEAYDEIVGANKKLTVSTKTIKYEKGVYNEITDRAVQTFQVFYSLEGGKKKVHTISTRPLGIDGSIDKNTLLAMDEALVNGWEYEEGGEFFPLDRSPIKNWAEEGREFGTRRQSGTRAHAGCDLYDKKGVEGHDDNEKIGMRVYSVKKGRVVGKGIFTSYNKDRGVYESYAIAVHHGKFTARYCEVSKETIRVEVNDMIKANTLLAQVKNVLDPAKNTNYGIQPMLHFEMYSNIEKGDRLSISDTAKSAKKSAEVPYYRRKDLINPTKYLDDHKDNLAWLIFDSPLPKNPFLPDTRIA